MKLVEARWDGGNMGKLWEIQKKSLAGSQNVDMYQRILFFNGVLYM
jgi:hypothetical protein